MARARRPSSARKTASRVVKKTKVRARKTVRAAKRAGQNTRTAAKKAAKTVKGLKRPGGKPKPKKTAREAALRTGETLGATLEKALGAVEQAISQMLPERKPTDE